MSIVGNQRRILRHLLETLRPHWRRDPALAERIERQFRGDRRLGSRDRRLYRELIYSTLRYLPWIEPLLEADPERAEALIAWLSADTTATAGFRAALTAGWPPCPEEVEAKAAILAVDPAAVLPSWLARECPEAFAPEELDALCARSPLWLRLQTDDPAPVLAEFGTRGWTWSASEILPQAICLCDRANVTATEAYRRGWFEIQDLGSQMILEAAGIEPGTRWLDACAGAGGKTLQLARLLGAGGRVDAHDIRPEALAELKRRAARAGLGERITTPAALADSYEGVLIDAPCSGTGTWRRQPHLKWTTRPEWLPGYAARQLALLTEFAPRVRPGGRLLYATCSLCRAENEEVIRRFLASAPPFVPEPWLRTLGAEPRGGGGLMFWPAAHNGDGFFAASLRRKT